MRIEDRVANAVLAGGLALAAGIVNACGFCIEDREAAVYDYEVIATAQARGHRVVFFAIEGEIKADESSRRALVAALEGGGADVSTARVALPSASCSAAYDPAQVSLAQLSKRANQTLAARGLTLAPLRMTVESGALAKAGD